MVESILLTLKTWTQGKNNKCPNFWNVKILWTGRCQWWRSKLPMIWRLVWLSILREIAGFMIWSDLEKWPKYLLYKWGSMIQSCHPNLVLWSIKTWLWPPMHYWLSIKFPKFFGTRASKYSSRRCKPRFQIQRMLRKKMQLLLKRLKIHPSPFLISKKVQFW